MNTRKVLKAALIGCDRGEVAKAVGMTLGSLNNQVAGELPYLPKGRTPNMLDRVYGLIDITFETTGRMDILEKFAEEFGYMLIANPTIRTDESPAVAQIARILKEFSDAVEEIGRAHADGRIELCEAERIRARWEIAKRTFEEFVTACEAGKFNSKSEDGNV